MVEIAMSKNWDISLAYPSPRAAMKIKTFSEPFEPSRGASIFNSLINAITEYFGYMTECFGYYGLVRDLAVNGSSPIQVRFSIMDTHLYNLISM
jgi:hypothetical protein